MIRPAQPGDLQQLLLIDGESGLTPWSEEDFRGCLTQGHLVWALLEQASVVAYAIFALVGAESELLRVAVARTARRRGCATRLLSAGFHQLAGQGITHCFLEVRGSNQDARSLYEGLGFEVEGRRVHYYRNPDEDAIVMRLSLTAGEGDPP